MQELKKIDKVFYKELGKQLRNARERADMTLRELSQETGISRPLLDHYELGHNQIPIKTFERICETLNVKKDFDVFVTLQRKY